MSKSVSRIEALEARITPASLPTLDFPSLGGTLGFEIISPAGISGFERVGDFNDDGVDDLLIYSLNAASNAGVAYLVYGQSDGFPSIINLTQLDGANGFSITGEASGDKFGRGFAAGDVNGDGFDDIIIGAPGANNGGDDRGSAYIIYGRATTSATLALNTLDGSNGLKVNGTADNDYLGFRVGGNGDFNGDGFDDLIIGAPRRDSFATNAGAAYVIYGKATSFAASFDVSTLDGTNGFTIGTSSDQNLGTYVRFIGDLDRDGRDEISIGESAGSNTPSPDQMNTFDLLYNLGEDETGYVIFGAPSLPSASFDISTTTSIRHFKLEDTEKFQISSTASRMQDFTGDGIPDFVISGADGDNTPTGVNLGLVIVPGRENAPFTENPLTTRGAKTLARFIDIPAFGSFSFDTGDFNGDGLPDFVIDRFGDGGAEMYFGYKLGGYSLVGKSRTDQGIAFTGLSDADTQTLKFAGDLNGDGFDDLIATTPVEGGGVKAVVVFGTGLRVSPNGQSATFLDVDGDLVTVTTNKGTFDYTQFRTSHPEGAVPGGFQLDSLDLSNHAAEFAGANITISVKRGPLAGQGDGKVNVIRLNATGVDLGNVKIEGNLGEIDAGDGVASTAGLKKLDVYSFTFVVPGGSSIGGSVGNIKVRGEWNNSLTVSGTDAGVRSIQVGNDFNGVLQIAGTLGSFKSHDFIGSLITGFELSSANRDGSTSLAFHKANGSTIDIGGAVSSFKAVEVIETFITADKIASLIVSGDKKEEIRGDLVAIVTLDNAGEEPAKSKILGKASIAGIIADSRISVAGSVGSFSAAAITDSKLYVGFSPSGPDAPLFDGTFLADATVGSFSISGKHTVNAVAFDNSAVVATSIGTVKIASIDSVNGGVASGVGFQTKLKSLKVTDPSFTYDIKLGGTQSKDNFQVADLT